jgi:arabinose-5-phosphate isomerase
VSAEQALALARRVLAIEADAIASVSKKLGEPFVNAVELMLNCRGRVVVCAIGKSGHVGRKLAATLASTGTPAFFVHATEAMHGDLG